LPPKLKTIRKGFYCFGGWIEVATSYFKAQEDDWVPVEINRESFLRIQAQTKTGKPFFNASFSAE
jgi:hypothetical protein